MFPDARQISGLCPCETPQVSATSAEPLATSRGLPKDRTGFEKLTLNSDLPTNPLTQLTIAQFFYVSNIARTR